MVFFQKEKQKSLDKAIFNSFKSDNLFFMDLKGEI